MTASPVRLMFDARMARHGGIGTYIRQLLGALQTADGLDHLCLAGLPDGTEVTVPATWCRQSWRAPIYSLAEQLARPASPHAALWHSPHLNIPLRWRGRLVVTIHDLIHLTHPQYARSRWAAPYAALMLRQIAARADVIVTVSEATKRVVCERTAIDPARILVIPHGADSSLAKPVGDTAQAAIRSRLRITAPYVLWVSTVRPHKNPLTALRAFAQLRRRRAAPHQLVMVGDTPAWYPAPRHHARGLGIDDAIRWVGTVPRRDLAALYQGAAAFVMPSYVEGFGLPALEAMTAGCPVLVSTTPALSELVANEKVTIDPDDVDGWSERLYTILFNDEFRRLCQQHGHHRAGQFTWERSAIGHLQAYRAAGDPTIAPRPPLAAGVH